MDMRPFISWWRLLRLKHGLTASVATWVVATFCRPSAAHTSTIWLASVAIGVSCVSASVFHYGAANRIYTRKGETTSLSRPSTLIVCGAAGFLLSLIIGWELGFAARCVLAYNALAVVCYARWLSRHWATKNLTIALVLISPIIMGYLVARQWPPLLGYLLPAVFCGYLAREMAKDISDIRANCGLRVTLPIWIGVPGTARLAILCLAGSVALLLCAADISAGHRWSQVCMVASAATLGWTAVALAIGQPVKVAEQRIEYGHLWLMTSLLFFR